MKSVKQDCRSLRQRRFSVQRGMVIQCLIVFSMLTVGIQGAFTAMAFELPVTHTGMMNGQQTGKDPHLDAGMASRDGQPPQDRQSPVGSQEPMAKPPSANPLEALKQATGGNPLGLNLTRQGALAAVKQYKAAFEFYKNLDMKIGMAASRFACGGAYFYLGQDREALSAFLEASDYSKESSFDFFLRPMLEASTGATYARLGETGKALETLTRALPTVRLLKQDALLALTLESLGEVSMQIGQKQKALDYLTEAASLYHKMGYRQEEIMGWVSISVVRSTLGQKAAALEAAQRALALIKEDPDPSWEALSHLAFGAAYASAENSAAAIEEYNKALQLFQAQHDKPRAALVLNNLGLLYNARGEPDAALDYFQKALQACEACDDDEVTPGYTLNNIGIIYALRGEPHTALHYFEQALAAADQHHDRRLKAVVLSNMSDAHFLMGNREYAAKLLKENAAILKEIEEPAAETVVLISLADIYTAMGRHQEALDVLRPLLESRRQAGDTYREGYVLREMGALYMLMGDRENVQKCFAEALAKLEAARDAIGQVDLCTIWGAARTVEGDYQKAEELYLKGLALAQREKLHRSEINILMGLGALHERRGELAQAERFYDQELAVCELLRSSARVEELKAGVSSLYADWFLPVIRLKLRLGKWAEAFELVEQARARTFLDQMNGARVNVRKGSDPGLADQEQSLRFEIHSQEEKLRQERQNNPRSETAALLAANLKEKEDAYAALLLRLKASNPEYAQLRSYSPVPLKEIQQALGPQATMVSYYVTADKTFAFVVSADALQVVEIPVKESDLRAAINWFRGFASLRDAQPQSLRQLGAWLIAPVRQYIKTSAVVVVPHGILHYVPFAALTDGQRYFGDEHTICYLPSASVLLPLQHHLPSRGEQILAVAQSQSPGLPALRYADDEAGSVAMLYHTKPLPTGRATRAEFLKRAGNYDLLHIAAHAELNTHNPLFSRILLAPDRDDSGAVEVREIYGMDLTRTNLVALSACETQLGARSMGDEVVGLNRAFIYAGASSVIASLWTVDDEATSLLMKNFYSHLKQGLSKAAALQAAQAATRRKYPHPYYWAGFVLTGAPGDTGNRQEKRAGGQKSEKEESQNGKEARSQNSEDRRGKRAGAKRLPYSF